MSPEFLRKRFEKVPRTINLVELGKWVALWVKRHDNIGQISYVTQRLRGNHSNYEGDRPPRENEFSISIPIDSKEKIARKRKITYFKEIDGDSYTREVIVTNNPKKKNPVDTEELEVIDTPQTSNGEARKFSYSVADEGYAGESDLPFAEIEEELTVIYKQVKPVYWGAAGPPGG